jgi:glyoxylase-like metal-dependent hydrolase (beta-lactamase superfamily II)
VETETYTFTLGGLSCTVIRDYGTQMPMSRLVAGGTPEELEAVARKLGLEQAAIPVDYNCLLVRTEDHTVLVDAGYGHRRPDQPGCLPAGLTATGVRPGEIDRIIITHADGDHIGGLLNEEGGLAYAQARCVLWQGAWEFWQDAESLADWPAEVLSFILGTYEALGNRLDIVSEGQEFLPGFQIVPAVGHRYDHVALRIASEGQALLHLADAVIHPLFLERAGWASTYDFEPEEAVAVKRQLLDRAAAERALVFGAHFPFPGLGYVQQREKGWVWAPLEGPA